MNLAEFLTIIVVGAFFAGLLGSLTGLGGGVVIVPLLTLGLGVDVRYAAGASLLAVIGASCGAGAVPSRFRFSNLRIGLFLEVAAVAGALAAALAVTRVPVSVLSFCSAACCCFPHGFRFIPLRQTWWQQPIASRHCWISTAVMSKAASNRAITCATCRSASG